MQIGSRRAVLNPVSGTGDHADYVTRMLEARGFAVDATEAAGDARRLGREAGERGVSELAVCGGDGTVNAVLRGLADAGHLGEVTLGVVPCGTANILAREVGIRDIDHGIELADSGPVRDVDVGYADGDPFAVSVIAGFPADASLAASSEMKERFGTLAFVITGVQQAVGFDGIEVDLDATVADGTERWHGEATCVLVGNARKFIEEGGQADMEDGLFDVAVVDRMPAGNLVAEAIGHRVLGRETPGVTHLRASELTISGPEPITFSRDGELATHETLSVRNAEKELSLRVGPDYEPHP
ncbi:diacylglycerol/lipid kinase family protein [Halosegnis marinus]|uniref:Diacylglycerol/lipid kinase family protein n=2 Tax=Halosegnis marinus TaxID=3034023 RepID=A0ABD5ZMM2_9EURY|nr:diacylglycerol kinase family protein [Halosegnis sp. DT85]